MSLEIIWIAIAIFVAIIVVTVISTVAALHNFTPQTKGDRGEYFVAQILGETVEGEKYVINDLIFADSQTGQTCQVDHIYINKYGIWVIETKNYSGYIFGKESDKEWTQVLARGKTKNPFYNPIKQNKTHIYRLSEFLKTKYGFHNIVVFADSADISNVSANNVCSMRNLSTVINDSSVDVRLSRELMKQYYDKLLDLKTNSKISIDTHIENIRRKKDDLERGICPRCGGKLVLRNGKNGQFYGCSNFPKCKFTKNK